MEGYLYKQSDTLKLWRRRWFRLVRNSSWLDYKELPKDKCLKGNIPLVDVTVGQMQPPANHQNWFCFYIQGPTFVYALAAESSEAAARWMDLIIVASAQATAASLRWAAAASVRGIDRHGRLQPSSSPPKLRPDLLPSSRPSTSHPESPRLIRDTASEPENLRGGEGDDDDDEMDRRSVGRGGAARTARSVAEGERLEGAEVSTPRFEGRAFPDVLGFFPAVESGSGGEREGENEGTLPSGAAGSPEVERSLLSVTPNKIVQLRASVADQQQGTAHLDVPPTPDLRRSPSVAHAAPGPAPNLSSSALALIPAEPQSSGRVVPPNLNAAAPRGTTGARYWPSHTATVHPLLRAAPRQRPSPPTAGAHVMTNVFRQPSLEELNEGLLVALSATGNALQVSEHQLEVTQAAAAIDARQLANARMLAEDISSQAQRTLERERNAAADRLRETEARLLQEREVLQAELTHTSAELMGARDTNKALQEEIEKLKAELSKAKEESAEVGKELTDLKKSSGLRCARLEGELAELKSKVKGAEETLVNSFWGSSKTASKS